MKPRLLVATTNPGKLREVAALLGEMEVLSLADFPGVPDAVEDGQTFEENARRSEVLPIPASPSMKTSAPGPASARCSCSCSRASNSSRSSSFIRQIIAAAAAQTGRTQSCLGDGPPSVQADPLSRGNRDRAP